MITKFLHGIVIKGNCASVDWSATKPVQAIITSPPYFAKRVYPIEDCIYGGWKGQLGQEDSPADFAAHLADILVALPLRDDGLAFINLGDTYIANPKGMGAGAKANEGLGKKRADAKVESRKGVGLNAAQRAATRALGLKTKDLAGVPWRLAFALQERGFIWRSNIVWDKANPMPESVSDRPTGSHESILMFAKSAENYYDPCALRERTAPVSVARLKRAVSGVHKHARTAERTGGKQGISRQREKGKPDFAVKPYKHTDNVWRLPTAAHRSGVGDHIAPMPIEICKRAILLSTRPGDWVLDPFAGTGTTCIAAALTGRNFIGVDLDGRTADFLREWYDRDYPELKSHLLLEPQGQPPRATSQEELIPETETGGAPAADVEGAATTAMAAKPAD